jgi:hypothetical protein
MAKRIVTRIGDVFSVALDNGNLRFFQFVAIDSSCLGGSVIRVFKKEYPKGYILNLEDVVSDDVDFYALTILRMGVEDGDWEKIGNCKNIGDPSNVLFREVRKDALDHSERIWEAWYINKEWFTIGKLTSDYRSKSDIGSVWVSSAIVYRIKNGVYPGTAYWPEEH